MAKEPNNDNRRSEPESGNPKRLIPPAGPPTSPQEDLANLGRILHLLSEVVSHLESCDGGLTRPVEQLLREGLETSRALLDHCVQKKSDQSYDRLTRKMLDLLRHGADFSSDPNSGASTTPRWSAPDPTPAYGETESLEQDEESLFANDGEVVMREVEENGRYHLEIETVGGKSDPSVDGDPVSFSAEAIREALGLFDSIEQKPDSDPETSSAEEEAPTTPTRQLSQHENAQVMELFQEILRQYAAPLARILGELFTGRASQKTIEGAVGIFRNVVNAADSFELHETAETASHLVDLFSASEMTGAPPTGVELKAIATYYETLRGHHSDLFPEPAWEPDQTDSGRQKSELDSIAVLEELKSIPGIGKRRIERLFAAGLSSLDALTQATPADFQTIANTGSSLARRLAGSFKKYRRLLEEIGSGKDGAPAVPPRAHRRLTHYLRILEASRYHYRKAALEDFSGSQATKKSQASIRRRTTSRILATLATLGLASTVCDFQNASQKKRIKLLNSLLEDEN